MDANDNGRLVQRMNGEPPDQGVLVDLGGQGLCLAAQPIGETRAVFLTQYAIHPAPGFRQYEIIQTAMFEIETRALTTLAPLLLADAADQCDFAGRP